jgi:hypothetical protein
MRVALVNPNWTYDGSIYFGCREPHLPTELGCARALLREAGHEVLLVDAHLYQLGHDELRARVGEFGPDMLVVTTAPTYLFWRCPPPELRVPRRALRALAGSSPLTVAVGPHPSTTPRAAMRKLGVDVAVIGECEEVLVALAGAERRELSSIAWRTDDDAIVVQGGPAACDLARTPALRWTRDDVARHRHHHHRFEAPPSGPGAEVEATRGCPYHCTFCNKENFRNAYRKRPPAAVLEEIDRLKDQGAEYVYFIDEIFLPNEPLLRGLATRGMKFGVQTRIDLWKPDMLALLGEAGCVSAECGVESLTVEGRAALAKRCKMTTEQLADRLVEAKRHIPFVQANLIEVPQDEDEEVQRWRARMQDAGVWSNDPVPLFPYPGSPDYRKLWGEPDDRAWERAHDYYLKLFDQFSDVQDARPAPLQELELEGAA